MSDYNTAAIENFAAQWGIDKYDSAVIDAVMRLVNEERIAIVKAFGTNILCRTQKRSNYFLIQTHESSTLWQVYDDNNNTYVGYLTCMCCSSGRIITDDLLSYCREHNITQVFARKGGGDDVTVDPGEDITIA